MSRSVVKREERAWVRVSLSLALVVMWSLGCVEEGCELPIERVEYTEPLPPLVPTLPEAPEASEDDAGPEPGKRKLPRILIKDRGNTTIDTFTASKRDLYRIHEEIKHQVTLYCGCTYSNKRVPNHASCGYKVRKQEDRARRIEAEHVMPASRFGRTFPEWVQGHPECERKGQSYKGRDCAGRASLEFARMEADLYNLYPAIGEVNGDRLDFEMAELEGEPREYGDCDVEIRDNKVEPREAVRGDIARIYLYMAWAYPNRVRLSKPEREMFERWDRLDPVDAKERARAEQIARVQGNINPFVE